MHYYDVLHGYCDMIGLFSYMFTAWLPPQYSVPVSVLIFCGWLVSVVSLGYLFAIYQDERYVYTLSS